MAAITIKVNGIFHKVELENDDVKLVDVLRNQLELTGTKEGCRIGKCGTCTVIMNGKAVTSCTIPAKKADGAEILTIEGMAQNQKLHPIQEAFIEAGAIQCGFCTPGLVMRTFALLQKNPHPTESEIKEALRHHLCRCTGYEPILAAVDLAQKKMAKQSPKDLSVHREAM